MTAKVAESKMLREKPALGMRHMILESRTFDAVVTGLISVGNLEELGDKTCEKLQQYTKSPLNKGDVCGFLIFLCFFVCSAAYMRGVFISINIVY